MQAASGPEPTFSYPGDQQRAITYRDDGNGTMSWTATVTVAGELRIHASDKSGDLNAHDVQVSAGPNTLIAPQPHSQIDDRRRPVRRICLVRLLDRTAAIASRPGLPGGP